MFNRFESSWFYFYIDSMPFVAFSLCCLFNVDTSSSSLLHSRYLRLTTPPQGKRLETFFAGLSWINGWLLMCMSFLISFQQCGLTLQGLQKWRHERARCRCPQWRRFSPKSHHCVSFRASSSLKIWWLIWGVVNEFWLLHLQSKWIKSIKNWKPLNYLC